MWLSAQTRSVPPAFHAAPDDACGSVAITARTATLPEIGAAPDATLHASLCRSALVPVAEQEVPKFSTDPWRAASRTAWRMEMASANQMP